MLIRIVIALLLLPIAAWGQSANLNDSVTVNTGVKKAGIAATNSPYDSDQVMENVVWSGGFEPVRYSMILQVGPFNASNATYFSNYDQYDLVTTNFFATNGTYSDIRQGASVCSGTITANTKGDNTSTHLTFTETGGVLSAINIVSASYDGFANGTYAVQVVGGGGSGATATFTITGATLGGSGYTGGSITATNITAAGSGFTTNPFGIIYGTYTVSSCGASGGFSVGDFVQVVLQPSPSSTVDMTNTGWLSSLSGGAAFIGETSDVSQTCNLPVGSTNSQAGLLTIPNAASGSISQYFDQSFTNKPQNYVSISGNWTLTVCAKQPSTSGTLTISFGRVTQACSSTVTPTTSWVAYTCTASGFTDSATVQSAYVTIAGSANSTIEIDSVSLQAPATANTTQFRDPVVTVLKNAGVGSFRMLNNQFAHTMQDILQPSVLTVHSTDFNEGKATPFAYQPTTPLKPVLDLGLYLGADAWYVLPVASTAADATLLQDYLGGTCSVGYPTCTCATTGATDRCSAGVSTPYTTSYASAGLHIAFEVGNENWNSSGAGMKWGYVSGLGANGFTPYGYESQTVFSTMKADSSYNSTVEKLILGAQTSGLGSTFYMDALAKSGTGIAPAADWIGQAPYSQTSANTFTTTVPRTQDTSALAEINYNALTATSPLGYMVAAGYPQAIVEYEDNNETISGSGGNPIQTALNGWANGEGYGVVNSLSYLMGCHYLHICQSHNLFTLGQFEQTFSNGSTTVANYIWGTVVGMGSVTNNNLRPDLAAWGTMNSCIPSNADEFQVTASGVATWNFSAVNGVPSTSNIPEWQVFGFKSHTGTQRCIILVNGDPVNSYTITLGGSTLPPGNVRKDYYHSTNINDDNESTNNVQQVTTLNTAFSTTQTIAPYSITAISYSTVSTSTSQISGITISGATVQ